MGRREQARQKKRKERERRVRHARNVAQSQAAPEPELSDEDLLDTEAVVKDETADAPPPLDPELSEYSEERLLRRVSRVLEDREFASDADRQKALDALAGKTPEEIDAAHGEDPVEAAQDLAFLAWETTDFDVLRRHLEAALALDPLCTDARTLLALQERRESRRLAGLQEILDDAARALGGELFLARETGHLWSLVRSRPYLRARHALMQALLDVGRLDEAIGHGQALLALDPEDHVLARNGLCGALLERGDLPAARTLFDRFDAEAQLGLVWGRVLERFLSGERREAATMRRVAILVLPLVEDLILGRRRRARPHDSEATLVESLSADVYAPLARAWDRHREARRWLADGAPATTAAERRAARDSYLPPVASLLHLGEPEFGGPGEDLSRWLNYQGRCGLSADDVPELLHMAADPALLETEADHAAVWGPVHAWRALAQLAGQGVESAVSVSPLLVKHLLSEPDDDWINEDIVHVLGAVGPPALEDVVELFSSGLPVAVRMTVTGCITEIGVHHASVRDEVIGTLSATLQKVVDQVESKLTQKVGAGDEQHDDTPADETVDRGEMTFLGLVVCGLMQLRAGTGKDGDARVALVKRALAAGLVDVQVCGTREEVLTQMCAAGDPPGRHHDEAQGTQHEGKHPTTSASESGEGAH